jgi:hypothetical protein
MPLGKEALQPSRTAYRPPQPPSLLLTGRVASGEVTPGASAQRPHGSNCSTPEPIEHSARLVFRNTASRALHNSSSTPCSAAALRVTASPGASESQRERIKRNRKFTPLSGPHIRRPALRYTRCAVSRPLSRRRETGRDHVAAGPATPVLPGHRAALSEFRQQPQSRPPTLEPMTAYTPLPIPPTALKELRDTDDAGRPFRPFVAREDGDPLNCVGSPLRCCLRAIEPREQVALVSYAPLRRWAAATGASPGAYDESGPVFVHAEECGGPRETRRYPFARPGALRTIRRYDAQGHIVGGRLFEIPDDAEAGFDQAFTEAFSNPEVALVHVRALEYGCWHFEVRRA